MFGQMFIFIKFALLKSSMASLVLKLTGDDTHKIRGMLAPDGMQVFSVYDFMTIACGYKSKDTGASARKEFQRLTKDGSEYQGEVMASCHYLKFTGNGQRDTPCMTVRGLQRLLMILGGKVAAEFRAVVEGVFTRVMAGDQSLIQVINANAASDAPVHQIYRQALAQEPVTTAPDPTSLTRKRRMEELEIEMLEADVEAKKLANAAMARDSMLDHLCKVADRYQELCEDSLMDERARLMLKDGFLNMAMAAQQPTNSGSQALIENSGVVLPNKPISLSSVAVELGFKIPDGEFMAIGKKVSRRYFQLHGKSPSKHDQLIKGKVTSVNSYTESDRAIVEEVLREHCVS
jgi:hypothetical protein